MVVSGVVAMAAIGAVAATADDGTDDEGGYPISVTVISSSATPRPSSTALPTSPRPTGSSTPRTSSTPTPTSPSDELPTLGETVGGVLYISGINTAYVPSINPGTGVIKARFTIRNFSTTTIDSSVTFRLTNFLGQQLSRVDPVPILRLEPNETRIILAELENPGQWTFTTASFTLSPTSLVDGARIPKYTRDEAVFFLPWFIIVLLVIGAAAYAIVRIVRARPNAGEGIG